MEACTRCHGNGRIEAFGHIRAGVCFRCWGCGQDLMGDLYKARKDLATLRRRWASLKDLLVQEEDYLRRESYLQAMVSVEAEGHDAKDRVARLETLLEGYRLASCE